MVAVGAVVLLGWFTAFAANAAAARPEAGVALRNWYGLALELVRHTATYSPGVASRAFAYMGITAFEATASGAPALVSLAGQVHGLEAVPQRNPGETYDEAVVVNAAMAALVENLFNNTGPTGQRSISAAMKKWDGLAAAGVPADVVERSVAYGRAVAAHIHDWSLDDGGATITNMGFPLAYDLPKGDGKWVPTSLVAQQQLPLLPDWGSNRTFAMPVGSTCGLPPPLPFSVEPASDFYKEAEEVYTTGKSLTPEQKATARFWSDDPMLSTTPPGHWISIALQVMERQQLSLEDSVDLMARLGIAQADAFIGCWYDKYEYDLIRPISYIKQHIDKSWEPILITPPFPEYPSGHSTASGAAATVLTAFFGDSFAFEDKTGSRDSLKPRDFTSFWAAADEAGFSRLLGGIHFRAAIERGLEQGRCIGAYAVALKTRT